MVFEKTIKQKEWKSRMAETAIIACVFHTLPSIPVPYHTPLKIETKG